MKGEKLGALLIGTSLLVIALIIFLTLLKARKENVEGIRVQGVGLVRTFSLLPLSVLAPKDQASSALQSLLAFAQRDAFAYGMVTSVEGKPITQVTSPGLILPTISLPAVADSLYGERQITAQGSGRSIYEFYGPVIEGQDVVAFIRLGYYAPSLLAKSQDLSFLGMMALLVFMLVPIMYFLLRRELRPLKEIQAVVESNLIHAKTSVADRNPETNLSALVKQVVCFVDETRIRIAQMQSAQATMVTTNRLLEYQRNKMEYVLHRMPDGIMILDPSGQIVFANEKVKPLLGINSATDLSDSMAHWCRDDALRQLLLRYRSIGNNANQVEAIEIQPVATPERHVRILAQALAAPDTQITFGTLIVFHDATLEEQGKKLGNEFVAHVSHELKSPLNVLNMYAELMQTEHLTDDNLRIEAANTIHQEAGRMTSLVNNLLNISKLETGGMQANCSRVKTDDLLRDIYAVHQTRAQAAGISFFLKVSADVSPLLIDKDLIRIAINNLLTNAFKYSEKGTEVTLTATENDTDVVISVRDGGVGIAPEDQDRIFEKFFRAEAQSTERSGHGLGLYLTKQIIYLHHGRVSLDSQLGHGSTFSIHLKKATLFNSELVLL